MTTQRYGRQTVVSGKEARSAGGLQIARIPTNISVMTAMVVECVAGGEVIPWFISMVSAVSGNLPHPCFK